MQYLRQIGVDVMQINMQKAIILATILLNLIASPLAVGADENQERRHRGPDRFEKIITLSGLNLTAEQTEKIMALHKAYREESEPFREQMIGKGRELVVILSERDMAVQGHERSPEARPIKKILKEDTKSWC